MKNLFFKAILALTAFIGASSAFAQCGGMNLKFLGSNGSFHCSAEEAWASDRARANLYGGNVTGTTFVQRAPVYVQQPVILQAMPQGHAYRACTPEEVLKRDGLMMLRGAVAGLLIGDNSRSAGVGAGAGLLFSMTGPCQVAVPVAIPASQTSLVNQGGAVTTAVQCQPGTSRRVLDWPGHPQHGQSVCLPPDEVIAQQKASRQEASPGNPVCTTSGTSWKKLDWEGHPQHGKFACLPPDEVIAQQKADHQKTP